MNAYAEARARRAVAASGWPQQWPPGMLGRFPDGSSARVQDNGAGAFDGERYHHTSALLPDFSDGASFGCLWFLVQKHLKGARLTLIENDGALDGALLVASYEDGHDVHYGGADMVEALVAALEAEAKP